ncbi:hypothetical protein EFE42_01830 [Methanohalophilus sp. RSK]|uniref:hypothetical protein n=1 Tax=Methanohalophilus sp. RSK TaxID=2485783 RepID=UPI000F43912A|nr:hypothetical protein [Methanohalophilus sp. RSK]RNI15492.1 hypothetical protein EFE42_01830 [Methanohalophilus sp. RSK]
MKANFIIFVIIVATVIIVSSHLFINFDNNEDFEDESPQKELKYNCNEISNSFDKSTIANVIKDSMGEKEYIIQNNRSNSTNSKSNRNINYQIVGLICLLFMASIVLFFVS